MGKGNLWITEYVIIYEGERVYTVSIMEFRDEKVSHETQYFADPFNAPAWRARWVETVAVDNIEPCDAANGDLSLRLALPIS